MPRKCSICSHSQRKEIESSILRSEPLRAIAHRSGTSKSALERHRDNCIPRKLAKAKELRESDGATDLVRRIREIHQETMEILADAKKTKNWTMALRAIARLEHQIELEAELIGELEHAGRGGPTRIELVYVDKAVITAAGPTRQITAAIDGSENEPVYQKAL